MSDPAADADVQAALEAAVAARVPRDLIDRELEAAAREPDDPLRPIILSARLARLASVERRAGSRRAPERR